MSEITIFIPCYNANTTILKTLNSIENQKTEHIEKIIIMDDHSNDDTLKTVKEFMYKSKYKIELIINKTPSWLAQKYNRILKDIETKYLILIHADIIIEEENWINTYYEIAEKDDNIAIVVWESKGSFNERKKYNFWQKSEFDLNIYNTIKWNFSRDPFWKFDLLNTRIIKKIWWFNENKYFIAGEDWDLHCRLLREWYNIIWCDVSYVHIHSLDKNYKLSKFIHRGFRYSQTVWVWLRNDRQQRKHPFMLSKLLISLLIIIGILASLFINNHIILIVSTCIRLYYTYLNNRLILKYCRNDSKIFLLPFIYLILIFWGGFYIVQWFLSNRQTI